MRLETHNPWLTAHPNATLTFDFDGTVFTFIAFQALGFIIQTSLLPFTVFGNITVVHFPLPPCQSLALSLLILPQEGGSVQGCEVFIQLC